MSLSLSSVPPPSPAAQSRFPVPLPSPLPFSPAWFVPGAHLQTLWRRLFPQRVTVRWTMERWDTPDGDFVDVARVAAPPGAPRFLMLHGLEGGLHSHYAHATLAEASRRGWGADMLLFRGCSGEPNRARRFYHSGETSDLAFAVDRIASEFPRDPLVLAGYSLGGNVLVKWLGERGGDLPPQLAGAAAVSVPFDLERGSRRLGRGFSKVYQHAFLKSLRRKALDKIERFPGLADREEVRRVRTIYDYDDRVTAPVHGFQNANDYYTRSSALGWLWRVRLPTLLLSAIDDPFLPPEVLDEVRVVARINSALHLEFSPRGGHVGFVGGTIPWKPFFYGEWRVCEFLAERLAATAVARAS